MYLPPSEKKKRVLPSGLPWAAIVLLVQGGHTPPRRGRTEWRLSHLTEASSLACASLRHQTTGPPQMGPCGSHLGQGDSTRALVDAQY